MLHKFVSAFILLESCRRMEIIATWDWRRSILAGFQVLAWLHFTRREVSSLGFAHPADLGAKN